jgi:hypothetical protein
MRRSRITFAFAFALLLALPAIARAQDPTRARDIVLGFFDKSLPDGKRHDLVDELKQAKGGLEYFEWDQMGMPVASYGTWDERRVWTAMELVATTGHRIQFNVTGFSFTKGPKDPRAVDAKATAGDVGFTTWELAQIRNHRAFWDAADFYTRLADGSYRKLSAAELARRGLRYDGPALSDLEALKGALVRETPTERVYSVPGRPGQELVVRLAPTGETEAERDRRAEALVEEKDALEKLATDGVAVAVRHEVGTLSGELAFVRDALASGVSREVAAGEKTLTLAKNAVGDLVVAGLRSPQVRPDAAVDDALARAAKQALAAKAPRAAAAARGPRAETPGLTGLLEDRVKAGSDGPREGER